jgi:hypothetical protein
LHSGRTYPFVHNTIGISHCTSTGEWDLVTYWRRGRGASPGAYFNPDANVEWVREARDESGESAYYWLFDGFVAHDVLFVGLLRVIPSEPRGPFNLPFRLAGMDLAGIENFRDHPDDWEIQISTLSNNTSAFPGSAFVVADSHLYAYAFFDRGDGPTPRMLSRLDLAALIEWQSDLSGNFETWSTDEAWIPGFIPSQAMILMADNSSEMSVHRCCEGKVDRRLRRPQAGHLNDFRAVHRLSNSEGTGWTLVFPSRTLRHSGNGPESLARGNLRQSVLLCGQGPSAIFKKGQSRDQLRVQFFRDE